MGKRISTSDIATSTIYSPMVLSNAGEFENLLAKLEAFQDDASLTGKGWSSAKELVSKAYLPLIKSQIMLSDSLSTANQSLKSYSNELKDSLLDEDSLNQELNALQAESMQITNMSNLARLMGGENSASQVKANNYMLEGVTNRRKVIQDKLDSLNRYDSATKGLFDEAKSMSQTIENLTEQISNPSNTWNSKSGLFTAKGIDSSLISKINKQWKEKDREIASDDKVIKFLVSEGGLTLEQATNFVKNGLKSATLSKKLIDAINNNPKLIKYFENNPSSALTNWYTKLIASSNAIDQIPSNLATILLQKPLYIKIVSTLPLEQQVALESILFKLANSKGIGAALAPLVKLSDWVGTQGKIGAMGVQFIKDSLNKIGKADGTLSVISKISNALDMVTVTSNAFTEFTNPDSPAYNDMTKAVYGGIMKFIISMGPIEGMKYGTIFGGAIGTAVDPVGGEAGAPIGGLAGFILGGLNTWKQMGPSNPITGKKWSSSEILNNMYKEYEKVSPSH
ncbi:T7SS effector LXG polymorphic toxin [Lactococcus lactis]|uniref:LXG domain-containing protein n=1 Tax=Lactococcus lactis subsp. lactis TaxID=1360 RepID=A0A0V8E6F0_LACLL|nr:T7SS effector LXG polymorphic toxin [Lactococcus lactis]KSU21410.1 hypothetical protein M20_1120 [Lactococcus lactis subsp. lactis]